MGDGAAEVRATSSGVIDSSSRREVARALGGDACADRCKSAGSAGLGIGNVLPCPFGGNAFGMVVQRAPYGRMAGCEARFLAPSRATVADRVRGPRRRWAPSN